MFPLLRRILCLVGLTFFTASCGQQGGSAAGGKNPEGPFKIEQLEAKREGDHIMLRITVAGVNRGKESMQLSAAAVPMKSGNDHVPPFVRPFVESVELAPGISGAATLVYWLSGNHLKQPLQISIGGQSLAVKSSAGFASDQLPEGKMVVLSCPDWRVL